MTAADAIGLYLDIAVKEGLCSSKRKLRFEMKTLYGGTDFKNKRVLDIGGGVGLHSFYAACMGAKEVLCLEPECAGSSSGMVDRFQKISSLLGKTNVAIRPTVIQELETSGNSFDVVLLHNSINHLNETACINLHCDSKAREVYMEIFSKIRSLSNPGARLVACDCSRHNLFALLGTRNPFAPTIEWHKHQSPKVWAQLLGEAGFVNPRIKWLSFNTLGSFGRIVIGNKLMAYFLMSHFCLTMDAPQSLGR